jgi:glycosyltransferase involved in cell wall biosynthesis
MKILELSDSHEHGGAAIAANRIHASLKNTDLEIERVSSDSEKHLTLFPGRKFFLTQSFLSYFGLNKIIEVLLTNEIKRQFLLLLQKTEPDVIHFHNVHCANWPIDIVKVGLNFTSVIWTLHDCWSFLGTYYPTHSPLASPYITRKKNLFWKSIQNQRNKLVAITPSMWMNNQASSSLWIGKKIRTIHNPLPAHYFKTIDRTAAKKTLGLKLDQPVVLCISSNLDEERKGGNYLKHILNSEVTKQAQIILCGNTSEMLKFDHPNIYKMGFIKDELMLQILYSASDILVHPAPIDNLPNTVAESLSAGTPVLAFKSGGLPEMVIHGKTGWLAQNTNEESLVNELLKIIASKSHENLRKSSQLTALELFDEKKIAKQYLEEFNALCLD